MASKNNDSHRCTAMEFQDFISKMRKDKERRLVDLNTRKLEGRKLFEDQDGNPVLRESFVTYLDELGTSDRLCSYDGEKLKDDINLYDRMRDLLHDDYMQEDELQRTLYFSDNVVVVKPVDSDLAGVEDRGLFSSIFSSGIYQLNLTLLGRFLRGGIAVGQAYADTDFVTGPAHLCAVRMEERAKVPRIILDEHSLELARKDFQATNLGNSSYDTLLLRDEEDGEVFVNYLSIALEDEGFAHSNDPLEILLKHRELLEKMIKNYPDEKVRKKYDWVASYHNFVISQSSHRNDRDLYIKGCSLGSFSFFYQL